MNPRIPPAPSRHAGSLWRPAWPTNWAFESWRCRRREMPAAHWLRTPPKRAWKKTMAYEVVEQLGGQVPNAMIYPTGGGTGLIGMWKAFAEMEELGWTGGPRPRMFSVQAQGCAPIVRAFAQGGDRAEEWVSPE